MDNYVADEKFQILSLSGGGIRGLYTIQILALMEESLAEKYGERDYCIGKNFNLICGTSIGGILALALANGISARTILAKMDKHRLDIFPTKQRRWFSYISWLSRAKYSQKPLQNLLVDMLGDKQIGDLKTGVVIPTVNYSKGMPQMIKTPHHKDFRTDYKLKLVDVALATSAAPTYFPIHKMNDSWFLDGGLVANSPLLVAIHEATHFLNVPQENLRVMQIGTMGAKVTTDHLGTRNRGLLSWSTQVIKVIMAANESLHNYLGMHLLQGVDEYIEIDDEPSVEQCKVLDLDNASDAARQTLISSGKSSFQYVSNHQIVLNILNHQPRPLKFFYGPRSQDSQGVTDAKV